MLRRRPFSQIASDDAWRRCAHAGTALVDGAVQLEWTDATAAPLEPGATARPVGGLGFDRCVRAYRTLPAEGRIERLAGRERARPARDLLRDEGAEAFGEFEPVAPAPGPLRDPRALAFDDDGRMFVAETGLRRVLVFDLLTRRCLRSVSFAAAPCDLASDGRRIHALLAGAEPRIAVFEARSAARFEALPVEIGMPARLDRDPATGTLAVLAQAGGADARVHFLDDSARALDVAFATDIALRLDDQGSVELVVARGDSEELLRFRVGTSALEELPPLRARGYDGSGIAVAPDGRIAYVAGGLVRIAMLARARLSPSGRVVSFRLDSREFGTRWGRAVLEACIPHGTSIRVHALVADEPPTGNALPYSPPSNAAQIEIRRPDLTPPLPPLALLPDTSATGQSLARCASDPLESFARNAEDDPFEQYEAPVIGPTGRYLWIVLELLGSSLRTPRVRSLRVEHPGHDLLRRLPKVYSRDNFAADFLHRYLAPAEGELSSLFDHAAERHALVDPRSAPQELLPWLASFVGLTLDERLSVEQKRTLVREAIWLFRLRGTPRGLTRLLEIVAGAPVLLIEHFRLRGLGVGLVGEADTPTSRSILGAGFRVGGGLDDSTRAEIQDAPEGTPPSKPAPDAVALHAHRFTAVVQAPLDAEREAVVRHALEVHRPAHTLFQLCSTSAGMRVGRGLHVGLTAILGETSGFDPLVLGRSLLGRRSIVGRPEFGTTPGGDRIGRDTHVG